MQKPGNGNAMKIKRRAFVLLFLLAGELSAAPDKSRLFSIPLPIIVNGAEVAAGVYTVDWESREATAMVTFTKDGRFIAGEKGTWVKQGVKSAEDAVLLRVNPNGSRSLVEIRLAGFKKTIVFANPIVALSSNRGQNN